MSKPPDHPSIIYSDNCHLSTMFACICAVRSRLLGRWPPRLLAVTIVASAGNGARPVEAMKAPSSKIEGVGACKW